jgi:hypothetical protein
MADRFLREIRDMHQLRMLLLEFMTPFGRFVGQALRPGSSASTWARASVRGVGGLGARSTANSGQCLKIVVGAAQ